MMFGSLAAVVAVPDVAVPQPEILSDVVPSAVTMLPSESGLSAASRFSSTGFDVAARISADLGVAGDAVPGLASGAGAADVAM
jgi:hypothetical protein